MSLFSAINLGKDSLQTSQNAINTTTHNLTNINTPGYTRQQILLNDKKYINTSAGDIGSGVNYAQTRQVRDEFLDKSFREQNSKNGYLNIKKTTMEDIEELLSGNDELFKDTLNDLWCSIQELSKNPDGDIEKEVFIQRCNNFCEVSKLIRNEFENIDKKIEKILEEDVQNLNYSFKQIAALNKQIIKMEADGENANDLRDEANLIIDKISKYTNLNTKFSRNFGYEINVNGINAVSGVNSENVEIKHLKNNGGEVGGILEKDIDGIKKQFDDFISNIVKEINDVFDNLFLGNLNSLTVNEEFKSKPGELSLLNEDKSFNKESIDKLLNIDFFGNFNKIIKDVGIKGKTLNELSITQEESVKMIDNERSRILNVDSDEELVNLMTFQNMYNASSRYINTVNEMIETLLKM